MIRDCFSTFDREGISRQPTGWVSHEKGGQYLRRAYEAAPNHPVTWYFLAGAILDHEPEKRDEALRLLGLCATPAPRPDTVL